MHSDNFLTEIRDPRERPAAGVGDLEGRISQKFMKGVGKASQTERPPAQVQGREMTRITGCGDWACGLRVVSGKGACTRGLIATLSRWKSIP